MHKSRENRVMNPLLITQLQQLSAQGQSVFIYPPILKQIQDIM